MANGFLLRSLPFTAISHNTPVSGTSGANLKNDFMGMVLKTPAFVAWDVRIDLGSGAPSVNTVAVLNADLPSGTTVTVQAKGSNDAAFSSPVYNESFTIGDNFTSQGFRHLLHLTSVTISQRWVRISISAVAGFELAGARVVLGTRYEPARNFGFGVQRGARDLGEVEFGGRGALLRRGGKKLRTLGLGWGFLTKAEAEADALPFLEAVGNTEFVLACLDPGPDNERSRRLYFGPIEGNLGATWFANGLFEKRLQIASVI